MYVITILAVITLIGLAIIKFGHWEYETLGEFCLMFGGILFTLSLIMIPINRGMVESDMAAFEASKRTIENAKSGETLTRIDTKVELNQWLANKQYWNNTSFDIYIPDAINDVAPIK